MLFSIVIPVYNVEKYLNECFEALDKQSFRDFEVVIVDDGSTDGSRAICDDYASSRLNVRVIHKENEGLLLARRTGLQYVKGDYILHCDSDDYFSKDAFETISKVIEDEHPDMIMFGYDVVDNDHNHIENHYRVFENKSRFMGDKSPIIRELVKTTWLNNMVTKATKRECVDIEGDYSKYKNISMGEDLLQVIPLVDKSYSFHYIAKPLYNYRYNSAGMSKAVKTSYLDNYLQISERLLDLCKDCEEGVKRDFYERVDWDVNKYLLRFIKQGMNKNEYIAFYDEAHTNKLYIDGGKYRQQMAKRNGLLRTLIKPGFIGIAKILSNTVLSKRL